MKKKKFLIVTLINNDIEDLNNYSYHTVFLKYKNFSELFDVVDIRDYSKRKHRYQITIIDRFAWAALMIWKSLLYKKVVKKFKRAKKLVLLTSDLHSWSLFPNYAQFPCSLTYESIGPHSNDERYLIHFFNKLNIKHLITHYDCPELEHIKQRSQVNTHIIDYHIDPVIFKNYDLEKTYDIIVYGSTGKNVYPFRYRVKELLKNSPFNVLIIDPDANLKGEELARLINQSWIGLATVSNFSYLVGKYFEISACHAVVLGNMNAQGKKIWADNYIHIADTMTDVEIISSIERALQDKKSLTQMADRMYATMHNHYTLHDEEIKLFSTCEKIIIYDKFVSRVQRKIKHLCNVFNQTKKAYLELFVENLNTLRMILKIRTRFNQLIDKVKG